MITQDINLPERVFSSPTLESTSIWPQPAAQTPRERIISSIFKRGSKDLLTSNRNSTLSPLNSPRFAASTPQAQSSQLQEQTSTKSTNSNNAADGSSSDSSPSTSVSTPRTAAKSILKSGTINNTGPLSSLSSSTRPSPAQQQQHQPSTAAVGYQQPTFNNYSNYSSNNNSNNNHLPLSAALAVEGLVRPASPFAMRQSSGGSSVFHENTNNSVSSTHRSSQNLSPGEDPNYNLTQTDLTLEGLAQRWYAYQAIMRKHYNENPFYKRWTRSKWILLSTVLMLMAYSFAVFGICIGYFSHKLEHAVVVMEFHANLVQLAFVGSILGITASIVGLIGVIRENRMYLSVYAVLLWPVFALYVSVGYVAFRRAKAHLLVHLKDEWVKSYTREQRLLVQRNLKCCGYLDSSSYAEYDLRCFPITVLPGCRHKYNLYEENLLSTCWTAAFSIVPFHLLVMIASMLCSNHIDGMLRSARPGLKSFKEDKQD
ncbi:hypothetical protein BGZ98_008374 [Dissophora globulifera]|nr:hypothetical protein BGZ98_008374 [Dissophora globulifera]